MRGRNLRGIRTSEQASACHIITLSTAGHMRESHQFSGNGEERAGEAWPRLQIPYARGRRTTPSFPPPVAKGACCHRVVLFVVWVLSWEETSGQ